MKYFYDTEFLEGTQTERFLGIPYGKTPPTIDLISIGIVAEDGRELYLISKDFNLREAWNRYQITTGYNHGDMRNHIGDKWKKKEYWIRENVLYPIWKELLLKSEERWLILSNGTQDDLKHYKETLDVRQFDYCFTYKNMKRLINKYGYTNAEIAERVKAFVNYTGWEVDPPVHEYHLKKRENVELYGYYSAYDHVALCWLFGKMIDLPEGFPMYTRDLKQMFDEKADTFTREDFFTAFDFKGEGLPPLTHEEKVKHLKMHVAYPNNPSEHSAIHDARWNKELYDFIQSL